MKKVRQISKTEDKFGKAKRLKPEFDKLQYAEKLKFMDDNFSEDFNRETGQFEKVIPPAGIGDISVYPDLKNPDEIKLYNEWTIRKYDFTDDLFYDLSFDQLKKNFESDIQEIRKSNPFPDDLCREYMTSQLKTYSERLTDPRIQKEIKYYKGIWDLSRKIIDNSFLKARAYSNFIAFLNLQIQKGHTPGKPEKTFPDFLINIPDDKKIWFADQLKKEFKTEKGKAIRYMIEALKKKDFISLGKRQGTEIYNAIKSYFNRAIGSKQGIMDCVIIMSDESKFTSDKEGILDAEKRINSILKQINTV